jgi:carnitine-CoA ligase
LRWQGDEYSYSDLEDFTNRFSNGFLSLGVAKGDRVSVMMRNRPEYLWTLWGLAKIGALPVTVNVSAKGDLLAYYMAQSRSSWLVVADEFAPAITPLIGILPELKGVLLADYGREARALDWGQLQVVALNDLERASAAPTPLEAVDGADPSAIFYTSGTTGPSKGVLTPHSQACSLAREIVGYFGLGPGDVLFTCLPMFHVNAVWYTCCAAVEAGAAAALVPRFSASAFWKEVNATGATQFNFMGSMVNIIKSLDPTSAERSHDVRCSLIAPAPQGLVDLFRDRYGIEVITGFGATETYLTTRMRTWQVPEKVGTAGTVSPGGQVHVVDEHGEPVESGVRGELVVRPDDRGWIMSGYFERPSETDQVLSEGWFHTGDSGFFDADGYLHFVDRIKDSIRRRGENISAFEVESQVAKHPDVAEVAAIPVPSELGEEEVMVWIVPREGSEIDPVELVRFCEEQMARQMVPRFVELVAELPKTPTSRIEKYKLRQMAAERRKRLWDRERERT